FSQERLKRRRATSNGSPSFTRTCGIRNHRPIKLLVGLARLAGTMGGAFYPSRGEMQSDRCFSPPGPLFLPPMKVLGIETSCDETGIALYDTERGLLGQALFSQVDLHAVYGGVVPELASRDHVQRVLPLSREVLVQAGCQASEIDAVAYTAGPGLAGALLVGACTARALAFAWGVPALPVHHMEGHLLAPLLEEDGPDFPFVALLVSGGHTMLLEATALGDYHLLGESLDDAAGEAFDKADKMMGLPYPGGPQVAKLAEQGDPQRFTFPRPMVDRPGLDMSFS